MNVRQELHCHACNQYVQFNIDMELDGNHVLNCPNCGHEHCRVVNNGVITDDRWDRRNSTYNVTGSTMTFSSASTFTTYAGSTGGNAFLYQSWSNTITVSYT